jgi:transcription-repair coupling factor (superfamily II helicase)
VTTSIAELAGRLASGRATAHGVSPTAAALIGAEVTARGGPQVVAVTAGDADARAIAADVALFAGRDTALHIPANPNHPYAELSGDRGEIGERMAALHRLASDPPPVVALSVESLVRRVIDPDRFAALSRRIARGDDVDRDELAAALIAAGYRRLPVVDDPGTFAVRGGIVDVFPPRYRYPVRLELFGDEVESLRRFDPDTQRTLSEVDAFDIHPAREIVRAGDVDLRARIFEAADAAATPSRETRALRERLESGEDFVGIEVLTPAFHPSMAPLWRYFAGEAATITLDPDAVDLAAADIANDAARRYQDRLDDHRIAFPPGDHWADIDDLGAWRGDRRGLECPRLEIYDVGAGDADELRLRAEPNRELAQALDAARRGHGKDLAGRSAQSPARSVNNAAAPLLAAIAKWRADGYRVAVVCGSEQRAMRLAALLAETAGGERAAPPIRPLELEPGAVRLYNGDLSAGLQLPGDRLALITDADLFGARKITAPRQKRAATRARDALLGAVADFSQLSVGDYLVHQTHGVGRYEGLTKLGIDEGAAGAADIDFLHVDYVGGTLYLPVYRIGEVQRYVGAEGHKIRIDRLGGASWDKARGKVRRDVAALAEALLQLYAQRAALPGRAFPPADAMFSQFSDSFEFEETPDQAAAIADVLGDMERPRPMDRLVCGDVGYGKTEVALRAVLKAVLGGAQVAMLAPTTVLVEQHYKTMSERFAEWPVTVAKLSRFQKRADQLATIRGLAGGSIDAVVGTHRLLSKDVRFKDLGLIIVDEEQRFGVTHKERLKSMRTQTDVLTLTATPIPRTLHLAMTGLRDLSIIATPPADRRSIRTFIAKPDDGVLREAIRRELARGGQCFFVVPRIASPNADSRGLAEWAEHLARLIPEARIAAAHGQMSSDTLEKAMVAFVSGDCDVLVSTTIVESGLDISRANTMFVADADRFGLAQLYQLRGRIGRSRERAFCYLLVPGGSAKMTSEAVRRLETLQRFSDLGAGFMIASHDLEIRGAGELLGSKQSGFIAAVGFDAYTSMLEEAVAELRGEPITRATDPELQVETPGYIPDDYVPDTGQRLVLYKRLSAAADDAELEELVAELGDRYGPVPAEVVLLVELMAVKARARDLRATAIDLSSTRLALAFAESTPLSPAAIAELVTRDKRYQLTPDSRLVRRFDATEQTSVTEAARRCLLELSACVTSESAPPGTSR